MKGALFPSNFKGPSFLLSRLIETRRRAARQRSGSTSRDRVSQGGTSTRRAGVNQGGSSSSLTSSCPAGKQVLYQRGSLYQGGRRSKRVQGLAIGSIRAANLPEYWWWVGRLCENGQGANWRRGSLQGITGRVFPFILRAR